MDAKHGMWGEQAVGTWLQPHCGICDTEMWSSASLVCIKGPSCIAYPYGAALGQRTGSALEDGAVTLVAQMMKSEAISLETGYCKQGIIFRVP